MEELWQYPEDGAFPPIDREVFIWDACGAPHVCRARYNGVNFLMPHINVKYENVIAWMPIPEQPLRINRKDVLGDGFDVCFKE